MNPFRYNKFNSRYTTNRPYISVIIIITFSSFYWLFPQTVNGNSISNDSYSIDVSNIDTNPQPTTPPQKHQVLGSSTYSPNYFTTGPNYKVTTSNSSLLFISSQNLIDYGIVTSTNPVIRISEISLSSPQLGGQILSYEDHPLSTTTDDIIQNTTCDNGSCSPFIAAPWTNTLTYGFGYRCDSDVKGICDNQFSDSTYFKSYSEESENQTLNPIVTYLANVTSVKATVTYKVNISGTQKTGGYSNTVTYLAIPNF